MPTAAPPAHSAHPAQARAPRALTHSGRAAAEEAGSASGPCPVGPTAGQRGRTWQLRSRIPARGLSSASGLTTEARTPPQREPRLEAGSHVRPWRQTQPSLAAPTLRSGRAHQPRLPAALGNHPHSGLIASPSRRQVLARSPSPAVLCTTCCIISTTSTSLGPVPRLSQQTRSGPPGPRTR